MAFCIDAADQNKQTNGTWVEYQDSEFLIAHTSNNVFQRTLGKLQAPHRKKIDKGTLDPGTSKAILCQSMAQGLLLDWKNVVNSAGDVVPYSKESAAKALKFDEDFREFVQEYATDLDNFRSEAIEEAVKS